MDKVVPCSADSKEKRTILLEERVFWRKEKRSSLKLLQRVQMEKLLWRCRTLENNPKRYHQDKIHLQILLRTFLIWVLRHHPTTSIANLHLNIKDLCWFPHQNPFYLSEKSSGRNLLPRHEWTYCPRLLLPYQQE